MNVVDQLKQVYIINKTDIFGFKITKKNYITYHHIIKVEDLLLLEFPTKKTFENGIVLTRYSHKYLHIIEDYAPDIFLHINKIILLITKEKRLPTLEERNLLQICLEAFEYRMQDYFNIDKVYLRRVRVLKQEKIDH